MIKSNGKNIGGVRLGTKVVVAIYMSGSKVYEAIRSCFGKGFWLNDYGWNNEDGYKNE